MGVAGQSELDTSAVLGQLPGVRVPDDYPSLQAAVDASAGQRVNVVIASGHVLDAGLVVDQWDASMVTIVAEDPVVYVSAGFTGDLFYADQQGRLPRVGCLFDMQHRGGDGVAVVRGSSAVVDAGCGVTRAGNRGVYANQGSTVAAHGAVFDRAYLRCAHITRASSAELSEAVLSSAVTDRNVWVSRASSANLEDADIRWSPGRGVGVYRSRVSLRGADVSGAASVGLWVNQVGAAAASPSAFGVFRAVGCGSHGVLVEQLATADLRDAVVTGNALSDVQVRRGGHVGAHGVSGVLSQVPNTITSNGIIYQ